MLIVVVLLILAVGAVRSAVLPKRDTQIGQYPYQALIIQCQSAATCGYCGGTLLNDLFVITAAHCVPFKKSVHIHLGAYQFDRVNETGRVNLQTGVANIFRHEQFDSDTLQNDLAIVRLPYPIKYTDRIQPARLPVDVKDALKAKRCVITGWGKKGDSESLTPIMQVQLLTIITNDKCSKYYKSNVFETDMCAQGLNRESVCDGDSGGPLCLENTNILVGVTSYYHGTSCESGYPSGFMRITKYLDWIEQTINRSLTIKRR